MITDKPSPAELELERDLITPSILPSCSPFHFNPRPSTAYPPPTLSISSFQLVITSKINISQIAQSFDLHKHLLANTITYLPLAIPPRLLPTLTNSFKDVTRPSTPFFIHRILPPS